MISSLVLFGGMIERSPQELLLFLYHFHAELVIVASFVVAVASCMFLLSGTITVAAIRQTIWKVSSKHGSLQQQQQQNDTTTDHVQTKNCNRHRHQSTTTPQVAQPNKKLISRKCHSAEMQSITKRKQKFLNSKHGIGYGYSSSPRGYIDLWRSAEFPTLIRPIPLDSKHVQKDTTATAAHNTPIATTTTTATPSPSLCPETGLEVYLDYAGSAIPTKSLLQAIHDDSIQNQILANPHSNGPSASRTAEAIQQVKKQVLDFLDANAGPRYGFSHDEKINETQIGAEEEEEMEHDYHPGYDVIFTSGTTHALQIVAQHFDWDNVGGGAAGADDSGGDILIRTDHNDGRGKKSVLVYPHNSHTSVIGMREPAMQSGACFRCEQMDNLANARPKDFDAWGNGDFFDTDDTLATTTTTNDTTAVKHLLVFPLECNFGGTKSDARSIIKNARAATKTGTWYTLLDIAKAASTEKICLRKLDPDFACVSFYKIFGAPTGIGALLVKRSSKGSLLNSSTRMFHEIGGKGKRQYFGGGSVDIVLPGRDFVRPRLSPFSLDSLVHGTVNFRSILSLRSCFQEMEQIGGLEEVSKHTRSLVLECVLRLQKLRHYNDRPMVEFYGPWSNYRKDHDTMDVSCVSFQGSSIAFNVLRSDGTYVGYNEVSKLAALYKTPIQFRTGCFCNPGACHEALNIDEDDAEDYYRKSGKVCGDHLDVIDGMPTGAVRISIGKDSIWEDIDVAVRFLEGTFKDDSLNARKLDKSNIVDKSQCSIVDYLRLTNIYVFPIKSCGAMEVNRWEMNMNTGNLLYDREFALVDASGMALRLCRYPKMGSIRPLIDLEKKTLLVTAPECQPLLINLDADLHHPMMDIKVCGNKCDGKLWGSYAVSSWFSDYLGVRCWLARANTNAQKRVLNDVDAKAHPQAKARVGFENESPLLLLSTNSLDILNDQLRLRGSHEVNAKFFRPNLVVETKMGSDRTNPEDRWSTITIPRSVIELEVTGQCARCSMVDVDPESGMKGKTLSALAEYRRNKGHITFGIFLKVKAKQDSDDSSLWIEKGDVLSAKRLC